MKCHGNGSLWKHSPPPPLSCSFWGDLIDPVNLEIFPFGFTFFNFLELFSVRFCLPGSLIFKKYLLFLLIFFWSSLVPEFCLWNFLLSFYPFIIFQFSWTSYIFGVSAVLWILKKYNTCFHLWIWFHSYLSCFPLLVSILFSILSASHIIFVNLSPPSLPTCWDVWWFLHQVTKSHVDSQCFARKGLPCSVSMQRLGWFPRALQLSVFSWNGQLREEISNYYVQFSILLPLSWGQMMGKDRISFHLVCRTVPWYLYFHRACLSLHPTWCPWIQRHSRKFPVFCKAGKEKSPDCMGYVRESEVPNLFCFMSFSTNPLI